MARDGTGLGQQEMDGIRWKPGGVGLVGGGWGLPEMVWNDVVRGVEATRGRAQKKGTYLRAEQTPSFHAKRVCRDRHLGGCSGRRLGCGWCFHGVSCHAAWDSLGDQQRVASLEMQLLETRDGRLRGEQILNRTEPLQTIGTHLLCESGKCQVEMLANDERHTETERIRTASRRSPPYE